MNWILVSLFFLQLTLVYFISRRTIQLLFQVLRTIIHHDSTVFLIISIIFLPGTILHELSHFSMALILMLKVREIHIFPQWEHNYIKLGKVIYEKKDVVRSIFVGIAPIIIGLLFFWWLSAIRSVEIDQLWLKIIVIYIIFVVSSTMFSSKQDLVDLVYIIPVIIIVAILLYFFPVSLSFPSKEKIIIEALVKFLYDVNIYLSISIGVHIIIISLLYILHKLIIKLSSPT